MTISLRKSLEAVLSWGYKPHGNISEADCLCAQAFGFRGEKDADELFRIPGPPNERMGEIVRSLIRQHQIPFSVQGEIAQSSAMVPLAPNFNDYRDSHAQIVTHNPEGGYVSCYTVETLTMDWMQENGFSKVAIITHPLLCWRMEKVMLKLAEERGVNIEVIVPAGLEVVGYDPIYSAQWRIWNGLFWWIYEMAARQHHVLHSWI